VDLHNSFTVPAPIDRAWAVLLDVPRVAPCLPGATLDGQVDDATYQGRVKVKVGPIAMTYRGTVSLDEVDEYARRISLTAKGREVKGAGTASATATATLKDGPGGTTDVVVVTKLDLSGKPAQFGRAVLGDVSRKLIDQFAANLAAEIAGSQPVVGELPPEATGLQHGTVPNSASTPGTPPEPQALDIMQLAGGPLRRFGTFLGVAAGAFLLGVLATRALRRR
jgi:carbon monoxide dehydrogenase subunit G